MSLTSTIYNLTISADDPVCGGELPQLPEGIRGCQGALLTNDAVTQLRRLVFVGAATSKVVGGHRALDVALAAAHFTAAAIEAGARPSECERAIAHGARGEG